ncbi:MAG: GNAT family N-acetyltransferase [Bacteroidota bacterium]
MTVRRLAPADASAYRTLMLAAYTEAPHAFTSTRRERESLPAEWWRERVSSHPDATQRVFGAFDGSAMVGVAGLRFHTRERTRHKATLFGMYIAPAYRGRGLGRSLVHASIEAARAEPGVLVLHLTVRESNTPARRLYASCGFETFGVEPMAVRTNDGGFLATVHMWREVDPPRDTRGDGRRSTEAGV